jgi:hypothetical protein
VLIFNKLIMKKLKNNLYWHDQLLLLEQALAQWRCPVASSEALHLLHRVMRAVTYRHIAMAIKTASKVGVFLHHCFICCCPGSRWGNTEQVVTQWQHPVASGIALE